jgi:hypothetical protein
MGLNNRYRPKADTEPLLNRCTLYARGSILEIDIL